MSKLQAEVKNAFDMYMGKSTVTRQSLNGYCPLAESETRKTIREVEL